MGIVNDIRCSFCQQEDETIVHLFWDCIHVYTYIAELKTMLRQILNNDLHFSKAEFILGSPQMKPCINITFMIAKSHICSCKMRESRPSINVFKNKLIHCLLAEKYNSKKNSSIQKMYCYLERFYNSVGGEPYPHIDQFNLYLNLRSSVFPLCMFSLCITCMLWFFFVCIFSKTNSIMIICKKTFICVEFLLLHQL